MKKKIAFLILFFAACLLPVALMLLGVKGPNYEKRALASVPALVDKDGLNLDFPREFETYLTDNFGLRPALVSLNAALSYYVLGDSTNEKVIAGRDGWLYFNEELADYERSTALSAVELDRLCRTLALEQEYVRSRGAAFLFVIAPNKSSVYPEYMPARFARLDGPGAAAQLNDALAKEGVAHADLFGLLNGSKGIGQLYHKKDTHWNNLGAWLGYREIVNLLADQNPKVPAVNEEPGPYKVTRDFAGDLETMLMPAFENKDEQMDFGWEQNYTTVKPMRSPEDMDIQTRSKSNGLSVLMYRDSFTNALLPILSNQFGQVHYTRAVPYDYSLMDSDKPDAVVLQIVERNIRNMLQRAPKMPAPLRPEVKPDPTAPTAGGAVMVQAEGDAVRFAGYVIPEGGAVDGRVYVELYNKNGSWVLEPFQIFDQIQVESIDPADVTGEMRLGAFSMLLDSSVTGKGTFQYRVYAETAGQWVVMRGGDKTVKIK